jgi:arsenite methyltransferase
VLKPGGRLEVSDMVTSGPVPIELRESAAGWAECVTGALPEQEYLDLIAQAGFQNVTARRSTSMGETFGVSVYSVIASAQKPSPFKEKARMLHNFRQKKQGSCCG